MSRNTIRRVEVAAPIEDERLKKRIREIFSALMKDSVKARIMRSDGTYYQIRSRREGDEHFNSQEFLYEEAYRRLEDKKVRQDVLKQNREKAAEKKTAAKKTAAKRTPAKKSAAKTSAAKKSAAKPAASRKTASGRKTASAAAPADKKTPAKRGRKPKTS